MVLPICALAVCYFLVLATADGASIGFRAIGAMITFPVVVLITFTANFVIAFPLAKSRTSAFAFGMIAPILSIVIVYVYLWQSWRQYPDIG